MQNFFNFHDVKKENMNDNNPNWPKILDHPYRILIIPDLEKQIQYLI